MIPEMIAAEAAITRINLKYFLLITFRVPRSFHSRKPRVIKCVTGIISEIKKKYTKLFNSDILPNSDGFKITVEILTAKTPHKATPTLPVMIVINEPFPFKNLNAFNMFLLYSKNKLNRLTNKFLLFQNELIKLNSLLQIVDIVYNLKKHLFIKVISLN